MTCLLLHGGYYSADQSNSGGSERLGILGRGYCFSVPFHHVGLLDVYFSATSRRFWGFAGHRLPSWLGARWKLL